MRERERRQVNDAIVRLAEGDRSAFDTVFDGLYEPLSAYVRRVVMNESDVEDLAQQTLLKVFSRISEFDTTRDGVSWAFGIATFEIRTLRKRTQRRRETAIGEMVVADAHLSQEDALVEAELHEALSEALGQLRESDREILLTGAADPSASSAALRKRRQRALERLRSVWRYSDE